MRNLTLILVLLSAATASAQDEEPPREENRSGDAEGTRIELSLLAAHWFARAYKGSAQTDQVVSAPSTGVDSFGSGGAVETVGGTHETGRDLPTQLYRAFAGFRFKGRIDLGLEVSGRRLVLRDGAAAASDLDFSGRRFVKGEPLDYLLEYSSVDLDVAFNVTFLSGWVRLELRAGFTYVDAHARLRSAITGIEGGFGVDGLMPSWGAGIVVRPLRLDVVTIEAFARARGGGWTVDGRTYGVGQTEVGIQGIFFEHAGIVIGHRLESAQLDRDPSSPDATLQPGFGGEVNRRIRFAVAGPFVGVFAAF